MGCDENRTPYGVAPSLRLNQKIRLRVQLVLNLVSFVADDTFLQPPIIESKSQIWKNDPKERDMRCRIVESELMVKKSLKTDLRD
jgi:hypothetical protein